MTVRFLPLDFPSRLRENQNVDEKIRTFIAIELPAEIKRALTDAQADLKRERAARYVRWVAPDGIHLTLKFLGDVERVRLPEITRVLADVCAHYPPLHLHLASLGAFPNTRRPNNLWVGVTGDTDTLARLATEIEDALAHLGFEREGRAFSPHLTLGRVKKEARGADQQFVGEMVKASQISPNGNFRAGVVSLMQSVLKPSGAEYTQLAEFALGQNNPTSEVSKTSEV
jgi:2'-5' RNA ligase